MSTPPAAAQGFDNWLKGADALTFLKENARDNDIVIYAGTDHVFIHGILVPVVLVAQPNTDDLTNWNSNTRSSWGVSYNFTDPSSISTWVSERAS